MSRSERLLAHFIGGLRRPAGVGSVSYSWPLIGLYVFADHLEFGPGFRFMRRISRPVRVFRAEDVAIVGSTGYGVRFTFIDGERWIFGRCDVPRVLGALSSQGIEMANSIEPANWLPPL